MHMRDKPVCEFAAGSFYNPVISEIAKLIAVCGAIYWSEWSGGHLSEGTSIGSRPRFSISDEPRYVDCGVFGSR